MLGDFFRVVCAHNVLKVKSLFVQVQIAVLGNLGRLCDVLGRNFGFRKLPHVHVVVSFDLGLPEDVSDLGLVMNPRSDIRAI